MGRQQRKEWNHRIPASHSPDGDTKAPEAWTGSDSKCHTVELPEAELCAEQQGCPGPAAASSETQGFRVSCPVPRMWRDQRDAKAEVLRPLAVHRPVVPAFPGSTDMAGPQA